MNKVQRMLLGGVFLLALVVAGLALRNRQAPVLPADADHRGGPIPAACLECHGPQGEDPRPKTHPLGNECMRCHGMP